MFCTKLMAINHLTVRIYLHFLLLFSFKVTDSLVVISLIMETQPASHLCQRNIKGKMDNSRLEKDQCILRQQWPCLSVDSGECTRWLAIEQTEGKNHNLHGEDLVVWLRKGRSLPLAKGVFHIVWSLFQKLCYKGKTILKRMLNEYKLLYLLYWIYNV